MRLLAEIHFQQMYFSIYAKCLLRQKLDFINIHLEVNILHNVKTVFKKYN